MLVGIAPFELCYLLPVLLGDSIISRIKSFDRTIIIIPSLTF